MTLPEWMATRPSTGYHQAPVGAMARSLSHALSGRGALNAGSASHPVLCGRAIDNAIRTEALIGISVLSAPCVRPAYRGGDTHGHRGTLIRRVAECVLLCVPHLRSSPLRFQTARAIAAFLRHRTNPWTPGRLCPDAPSHSRRSTVDCAIRRADLKCLLCPDLTDDEVRTLFSAFEREISTWPRDQAAIALDVLEDRPGARS